jgi:hypothetical protein
MRVTTAKPVSNRRIRFRTIASNTGPGSVIESLIEDSISPIASCHSMASSRSRVSSATLFRRLSSEEVRRTLTFGALGRFVFVAVRRRFFMASQSAERVPIVAMLPPRDGEYRKTPAAS